MTPLLYQYLHDYYVSSQLRIKVQLRLSSYACYCNATFFNIVFILSFIHVFFFFFYFFFVVGVDDAEDRKKLYFLIQRLQTVRTCTYKISENLFNNDEQLLFFIIIIADF